MPRPNLHTARHRCSIREGRKWSRRHGYRKWCARRLYPTFQFSAIEKANGSVSGQFNLTFEGPGNTHIHGEIVCIRVDGSRAWIGNKITSSGNPVLVGS